MINKILLTLILLASCLSAQTKEILKLELENRNLPFGLVAQQPKALPKVGLVLSGGGARGLAQLGIIRILEERDIPIQTIVGTSIGSIIGGLYSSGYTIDDIDSIIVNAPWLDFFSLEKTDRRELFLDQKITEDKSLLALRIDGLSPVIPTSINTGLKVSSFINLLTLNAPLKHNKSYDELLYQYRAVSTNIVDGNAITISDGPLVEALRASSNISFLLPPIKRDSLILVDGGVVSNIPVDVAQDLGCNYVIAVNSTSPLADVDKLVYPWEIADQLVTIPGKILSEQQMKKANVVIAPDLKDLTNSDFSDINSTIKKGYIAGLEYADSIEAQINRMFCTNLNYERKEYPNLVLPLNPSNIETSIYNKYQYGNKICNLSLLCELYKLQHTGDYKNVYAEITSSEDADTLHIVTETNPMIKKIEYDGITLISPDDFKSIFSHLYKKPYNPKKVYNVVNNLLRKYRHLGYPLPNVETLYFDTEEGSLNLFIDEGRIDEVTITGNEKTNTSVIMRELNFTNKHLNINELEAGLNNLRSSNLFSEIKLSVNRSLLKTILTVDVEEKVTSIIRLGLRADNENKVQLNLDIREENLWGTGTDLGAILSGGNRSRSFVLEHRAHRIFDTYLTYNLRGYYQFNDVKTYDDTKSDNPSKFKRIEIGQYRQIFYGGTIGLGTQIQKIANLTAEGKYEFNEVKALSEFPEEDTYNDKLVSLKFKLNIDSQNKYPYPTTGSYLDTYYQTSQKSLGGDISFAKFFANYKGYFSLGESHNLNLQFKFGFGDNTLPLSQQFSMGGQSDFFGYRDYEYRGRQVLKTSIEYRYSLPFTLFFPAYLRARYDIGSIWANREDLKFSDLKHGLGFTLSLDSPLGPADFSVGRAYIPKKVENGYVVARGPIMFYFTIGYYF